MFLKATNGQIINLDHYGNVTIRQPYTGDYATHDASIVIDALAGPGEFYPITLWGGNESEANDKMAELWQAIQNSEWAFDFGENGTPRPVEVKPAHQPLPDDFGF